MESFFLPVCYHYIRPPRKEDLSPRIMGAREREFREHVEKLKEQFFVLAPDQIVPFFQGKYSWDTQQCGTLFTFDDGLSDHYRAACILNEYGIKGLFFTPTCFLVEELPANPTIIHYALAQYGIIRFLEIMYEGIQTICGDETVRTIKFVAGVDDPWEVIKQIKLIFKYELDSEKGRKVLIYIYQNLLLKNNPKVLEDMHLTKAQVKEMVDMGHSFGVHTRTHISVAASNLAQPEFNREIVEPQHYLEKEFSTNIDAFSYPFGAKKDCLSSGELLKQTSIYQTAYTVEEKVSYRDESPFEIGRYQPMSKMSAQDVIDKLNSIIQSTRRPY